MKRTWVNGKEATQISVYDRGLQYGDGLFETMRMVGGELTFWPEHLSRLLQGCQRLGIMLEPEQIEMQLTAVKSEFTSGIVKLVVTRGISARGYKVDIKQPANIICLYSDLPAYPEHYYTQGVDVLFCETTLSRNPKLAGLKHLNRLEHVLARMEWQDECQEGLMSDEQAHVIEGTMSNVFFIKNDVLYTPDIQHCGVAGIMRQQLLTIAKEDGIQTLVRTIPFTELGSFDAALLTNSLIGAWPVKSISGQAYAITPLAKHMVERIRVCQN